MSFLHRLIFETIKNISPAILTFLMDIIILDRNEFVSQSGIIVQFTDLEVM